MDKGEGHNAMITANAFRDRDSGTLQFTSVLRSTLPTFTAETRRKRGGYKYYIFLKPSMDWSRDSRQRHGSPMRHVPLVICYLIYSVDKNILNMQALILNILQEILNHFLENTFI